MTVQPPYADREPHQRTFHGDVVDDPMAWMRNHDDPRLLELVRAENDYTEAVTADLAPLADTLFEELRARIHEDDVSVPVRLGDWWYYSRTVAGLQYEIHCRAPRSAHPERPHVEPGAPVEGEQVLVDGNAEAQGQEFFELAALEVDHAGERIAVLVDRTGGELYDLEVRDAATGAVLDDSVRQVGNELAWSVDGSHLFYTRRDDAWRSFQVWRHEFGRPAETDVLVADEPDEVFSLGIDSSRDGNWLTIYSESRTTTEVRLLDLRHPLSEPVMVEPRTPGLDYDVEVDGPRILVTHNGSRPDFDVAWAPLQTPGRQHWRPLLTGEEGDRILGVAAFRDVVAVAMRHQGIGTVRLVPKHGSSYGQIEDIPGLGPLTTVGLGSNPAYDTDAVQVVASSLLIPRSVLSVGPGREPELLKRQEVPGYDPSRYVEERVWVTARDGERVPMSVARRAELTADGSNPGYLYGYGSYEASSDPSFAVSRLSLLERGLVVAIAHVRGGGELGRRWYEQGKFLAKPNTFHDFVDCGRALIEQGWVAPNRLVAEGFSAGGLLIGAAVNEAPELFAAVHAGVPFVDALTTILDPTLPLTVGEWEEWGNPIEDAEIYACMKAYSPYENVRPVDYPAILATTSINDTRVSFVEPVKWVQRLRETVTGGRPIVLRTQIVAGHGGSSGRYDAWRDQAFERAFLVSYALR
ncbi:S9 family peptidase [Metallococcus carri]|uniref:S9 family peptidase n=1 Tax=Metallococcus carri TaxID=1656884 RepID=UPI002E2D5A4D|nr:S9 family peptidase [Metallococcus carri]